MLCHDVVGGCRAMPSRSVNQEPPSPSANGVTGWPLPAEVAIRQSGVSGPSLAGRSLAASSACLPVGMAPIRSS